jgi:hypothetical protein
LSLDPTFDPTLSLDPTFDPTLSLDPTFDPTLSLDPTFDPTLSFDPTFDPTLSFDPTFDPTLSLDPTFDPTLSLDPTLSPTTSPPTLSPTLSLDPTFSPTLDPTFDPTFDPTLSLDPTFNPTVNPTLNPTLTFGPSVSPTLSPTAYVFSYKCKSDFAGDYHNCALLSDNGVKCFGFNDYGQLGYGDSDWRGDGVGEMGDYLPFVDLAKSITSLSMSYWHSCATFGDYSASCWGRNNYGRLGQGDTTDRGSGVGEMGTYLPSIDFGSSVLVKFVSVGTEHSCMLSVSGKLKCWGLNEFGQLGYGDTSNRGDQPGEMGDYLGFVDVGSTCSVVEDLSVGDAHACVLCSNGDMRCFGYNLYGQLGQGDTGL